MKLRFLTWNISFAYGPGSDGGTQKELARYLPKPRSHFENHLKSISKTLRDLEVDVAFLQEVDFDSTRSCRMNQLDWLARSSGLLHRLPLISWNHPYVPYPGLNPLHHFGRVVSGGGVISRFPLQSIRNDFLPKPRENSAAYNFFYLQRYLQIFKVKLPASEVRCLNFHLEAFSEDNRELHLIRLQDRLVDYELDVTAGDFNGPVELHEESLKNWSLHLTPRPSFPQLNAFLDGWILKKNSVRILNLSTPETGTVSDHLPVLLELECAV